MNLIIGAMSHYDYDKVKYWVNSIKKTDFFGDIVMICMNVSKDTLQKLSDAGVTVILVADKETDTGYTYNTRFPIHVERFAHIYEYLSEHGDKYQYVVTTDVKDVVFQSNPIEYLYDRQMWGIVAGSEALKYQDEPWGNQNLLETFGPYIHNQFKDKTIYNVGAFAGDTKNMKDLCLHIVNSAVNKPIPIVDQAVFNLFMHTQPYSNFVNLLDQRDGWACHAGTTVDPSKIEQFRPNLLEPEPIIENGIAYTCDKEKFVIFHQYDRIPGVKQQVEELYND